MLVKDAAKVVVELQTPALQVGTYKPTSWQMCDVTKLNDSCLYCCSCTGLVPFASCGPGAIRPYPFTFPRPLLLCLLVSCTLHFFLSYFIYVLAFSSFPLYQNSPTLFPGRMSYKVTKLNLTLVFCVLILCYMYFLVKDACLFFVVFDVVLFCFAVWYLSPPVVEASILF